ncbi:MAG: hypothetical protein HY295_05070 [Thaumarchaeota archaeon]|nr:hypothetical protein [Nitrososphaerota archaeon]
MWRPDQDRNNSKTWLIVAEIATISIIVISLATFIWENTGIGYLDKYLQVAFIGLFALLIIFAANYVINRRW